MDRPNKTCPACCEEIARAAIRCSHCGARQPDAPLMHRDVPGRIAGGVCSAIALQLNVDATLVRLIFVLSLAFSLGLVFWGYAIVWVLTPFSVDGQTPAVRAIDWLKSLFTKPAAAEVTGSPPQP